MDAVAKDYGACGRDFSTPFLSLTGDGREDAFSSADAKVRKNQFGLDLFKPSAMLTVAARPLLAASRDSENPSRACVTCGVVSL